MQKLYRVTGVGILGIQTERPRLRQWHFDPMGGEVTGLYTFPVDNDGFMARPRRYPFYERFARWFVGVK
jgi:hypothetical protein